VSPWFTVAQAGSSAPAAVQSCALNSRTATSDEAHPRPRFGAPKG
jgi:hypothetical protein